MADPNSPLIHLSQAHLNLLETCPPQFQRLYLEQLGSPLSVQRQERIGWGSQLHLLMQQRELGLPIEALLAEEEELRQTVAALASAVPEMASVGGTRWRSAEHCRSLRVGNCLLTAVYDLLIVEGERAEIWDWKTYLQPKNKAQLADNWQTRLYLYVLAETTDCAPAQISLTYWFVKLPNQPQRLTFSYHRQQHEQTRQDLTGLLADLESWLESYERAGIPFPHRSHCQESCPYFSTLGTGTEGASGEGRLDSPDWLAAIAAIEEIPLEGTQEG